MKNIFQVLILLCSIQSFAAEQPSRSPGEVCAGLGNAWTNSASPNECIDIIKSGSFDNFATAVCYNLTNTWTNSDSPIECLKKIKNNKFDRYAVSVCGRLTNALSSRRIAAFSKRRFYSSGLAAVRGLKIKCVTRHMSILGQATKA